MILAISKIITITISYCKKKSSKCFPLWHLFFLLLMFFSRKCYSLFIGFHFDTEEANNLLPGFLDSILGARQGETKIFNLLFPESWEQENLQGVNAGFTVIYHIVLLST